MAGIGSTAVVGNVTITNTNTLVTIINQTLTTAGTEYAINLPSNCKGFVLSTRTPASLKLAYTLGGTSSQYKTIHRFVEHEVSQFFSAQTIYLNADENGVIAELVCYHF